MILEMAILQVKPGRAAEFRAAFVAYLEWGSRLAVENSQRESRPPLHMPMPRWWWVCDATPGARVSALAPQPESEPQPITSPSERQPVSFAEHIRPLFRRMDRQSMIFAFDPFVGFFAGTLYDTVIDAVPRLLTYRAGSAGTLLGAACLAALLRRYGSLDAPELGPLLDAARARFAGADDPISM